MGMGQKGKGEATRDGIRWIGLRTGALSALAASTSRAIHMLHVMVPSSLSRAHTPHPASWRKLMLIHCSTGCEAAAAPVSAPTFFRQGLCSASSLRARTPKITMHIGRYVAAAIDWQRRKHATPVGPSGEKQDFDNSSSADYSIVSVDVLRQPTPDVAMIMNSFSGTYWAAQSLSPGPFCRLECCLPPKQQLLHLRATGSPDLVTPTATWALAPLAMRLGRVQPVVGTSAWFSTGCSRCGTVSPHSLWSNDAQRVCAPGASLSLVLPDLVRLLPLKALLARLQQGLADMASMSSRARDADGLGHHHLL